MWDQLSILEHPNEHELKREMYALIGLVAVRFADLEAHLTDIVGTLVHPNNSLLTATLTENLGLSRKLDLIITISRFRSDKETELKNLVTLVKSAKGVRNEFIHGSWSLQIDDDGKLNSYCTVRRIRYKDRGHSKEWRHSQTRIITPSELRTRAQKLDELCKRSKKLALELEGDTDLFTD